MTRHRDLCGQVVTCILALSLLILLQSCGGGSSPIQNSGSGQNSAVTITGISPNSVQAGAGDTTVAVSGTNFLPSSVVTFNGQPLATTYKSVTSLTAVIPASDLSSGNAVQIGVSNSSTSASTTLVFQINNPAPFLSSITPPSARLVLQALSR